jgi:methionyl-tRNA formyltransferase
MRDNQKIKIGFFGTPEFSLTFLKYLFEKRFNINFVVSQPPARSGRGKKKNKSAVQQWAEKKGIKTFTPEITSDCIFKKKILSTKVDFIVVVAYGKIIPDDIIYLPKYYTINIHASLLPRWRGAAPVHRAILSGDSETGVSIMKVEKKLDSGPVFKKSRIKIGENDSTEIIFKQIISKGKPLLLQTLNDVVDGKYKLEEQDQKKVTYANKIEKNESKIDWNKSASEILLKVRAFYPAPGAWTFLDNGKRVRILIAKVFPKSEDYNYKEQNFSLLEDDLIIKCGKGYLAIRLLQVEGKIPVEAKEFVNGYKTSYFLND